MASRQTILNFSAGPAKIPQEVLRRAQDEFLLYGDTGISVLEMSHRSPEFTKILNGTEQLLREVVGIPDNYKILFMHGGGTAQFEAVPLNLCPGGATVDEADYLVTGIWSAKAAKEGAKYCRANLVTPKPATHTRVAPRDSWTTSPAAKFLYYCSNETVHGVEIREVPESGSPSVPVVCDMTSNFLTAPVDVTKFGVIFAGTQKNLGMAGLCVVIVREDLIGRQAAICPSLMNWKNMLDNQSCLNTPPCYAIYMAGLVLDWVKSRGGLAQMQRDAIAKSRLVYDLIDASGGFYSNAVEAEWRSRVTIPFRVGGAAGDEDLEKRFLAEAKTRGMIQLKGHRSVGGIRAAIFNAMPIEEVEQLVAFMRDFQAANESK